MASTRSTKNGDVRERAAGDVKIACCTRRETLARL